MSSEVGDWWSVSDISHKVQENQRYVRLGTKPVACGEKLQQLVSWELGSMVGGSQYCWLEKGFEQQSLLLPSNTNSEAEDGLQHPPMLLIMVHHSLSALLLQEHPWVALTSPNASLCPGCSDMDLVALSGI